MAVTYEKAKAEAEAIASVANELVTTLSRIQQVLEHNSDMAIDWGGEPKPPFLEEDASGNLNGLTFSRQEVSNAIGSIDWVRKLLLGQTLAGAVGDHLGNLNKLSRPLG